MSKAKAGKPPSYGEAAARLEEILGRIEEGKVDIDELSGLVGEAAGLVALCREKIRAAEVQVKTITEQLEREIPVEDEDKPDGDEIDESIRY
jgi:exodeoxyribonuclease VII small subunit